MLSRVFLDLKILLSVFITKKDVGNIFKSVFESSKKHFECFIEKDLEDVFLKKIL